MARQNADLLMSHPQIPNWDEIAATKEFQTLVRKKRQFIFPVFAFFFAYFFTLPILIGYAPKLMSTPILGPITAAYAFARLRFKFRSTTLSALLILQMFPMVLSLVAFYVILDFAGQYVKWLGLNTQPGLIMIYLGGISNYIWMIKGYFETIPASMEESARIDGASQFQTFIRILLPMSLPIFAVVFILSFISYMSEYPVASVVLQSSDNWTLAVGANSFLYEQEKLWGRFSALAVLSGVPITVVFLLCQKFVIGGLTSGGVKE